jgi:hypothetical protein
MTGLALRRVAPLRPLPGWRIAAAVLMLGAALAGAAVLYSDRQHYVPVATPCGNPRTPPSVQEQCNRKLETRGWAGPTALALVFLGLAGSATVLVTTRRH